MAIRKIKLPGEQEPREIGALSSNIVYDAVTPTVSLNQKISSMEQIIEGLNSFEIAIVNTLPEEDIDDHTIYFVPNAQDSNVRDEYMYIDNSWEMIGSTTIDLSDYPTYDDITIVQGLTTGIPAATITVGATTTTLYAPTPTAVTVTQGITTGVEIGSIDVSGTTTTFYAPESEDSVYYIEISVGEEIEENTYSGTFINDDTYESIISRYENGENLKVKIDSLIFTLYVVDTSSIVFNSFEYSENGQYVNIVAINDSDEIFINFEEIYDSNHLAPIALSNDYEDLDNKPTIPTLMSQLSNDSGYLNSSDVAEAISGGFDGREQVYYVGSSSMSSPSRIYASYTVNQNNGVITWGNPVAWGSLVAGNNSRKLIKIYQLETEYQSVSGKYKVLPTLIYIGVNSTGGTSVSGAYGSLFEDNELYAVYQKSFVDNNSLITKGYFDGQVEAITSSIPSITATAGLTTGVTIGAIDINGVTTTLYAPEDTKVTQTDVSFEESSIGAHALLLSDNLASSTTTTTSGSLKDSHLAYLADDTFLMLTGKGRNNSGFIYINAEGSKTAFSAGVITFGTSTTPGVSVINVGNKYTVENGAGNSKGAILIYGEGNKGNNIYALDNSIRSEADGGAQYYDNYLPMVDEAVLAAGVTTGVGSSTVPVYMASTGELLACSLPAPTTYSLSMSGLTITLTPSSGTPSTVTIPKNLSTYTNDSNFVSISGVSAALSSGTQIGTITSNNNTVTLYAPTPFSGSYNDLTNRPTNVSAFTNDAGYLTSSSTALNSYVPTSRTVNGKTLTANISLTNTDVGAAATSHAHGSITSAGAITANTALAANDRFVFSDNSDSSLLKRSSIAIGSSTNYYLANNGTWQQIPTVSVNQTLTSGTTIGSVNGTNLYAPTPYNDSALVSRIEAIENLEWVKYYSGRSNPVSSLGNDGDIYLQY